MASLGRVPWKLILAYLLDWILIVGIAAAGGGLSYVPPYKRAFSTSDPAISYPNRSSNISTGFLIVLSLVLPAIIIVIVAVVFCPSIAARRAFTTRRFWARKAWELNAGLMGLGLSFVMALLLTQAVKNLFGKPRPDLLARCQPDLANIANYIVGGDGRDVAGGWTVVDVRICTQKDKSLLNDGFRSFFSGHSSSAFSGLVYLSLWLAAKLNVTLPYVQPYTAHDLQVAAEKEDGSLPLHEDGGEDKSRKPERRSLVNLNPVEQYRQSGAAVPIYGIIITVLPWLLAIWIASTRYQDYKHAGVDIFTGILVGTGCAFLGFRSYHSSLTRGTSWTWAPRPADHAFAVTTSIGTKVGPRRRPNSGPLDEQVTKQVTPSPSTADPEMGLPDVGHGRRGDRGLSPTDRGQDEHYAPSRIPYGSSNGPEQMPYGTGNGTEYIPYDSGNGPEQTPYGSGSGQGRIPY